MCKVGIINGITSVTQANSACYTYVSYMVKFCWFSSSLDAEKKFRLLFLAIMVVSSECI